MTRYGRRARAGLRTYARNIGADERTTERLVGERAGRDHVTEADEAAGGPGWQGEALTDRDRSIAVIAALVASDLVDERLDVHVRVARRNGLDDAGLTQLTILLTACVGQPDASAAMQAVGRTSRHVGPGRPPRRP